MSKTKLHTKKERIVTALTITILKSSSFITLPQTFKRRSTTTKHRLVSYTINGISARAKVNQFIYKTKLLGLINDFKIDNAEDFIVAIGKCFPQQVEKESRNPETNYSSKYQLVDFPGFGVKILFRISNHNINCNNITDDVEETYSIALKSIKSSNTFNPNDLTVTEYVFFTENCDCNRYKRIAENLLSFAETSVWDNNYVPADRINISPKETLKGTEPINWELYTPDWDFINSFPAKDWRKAKQYAKEYLQKHNEVEYIEFQKCEVYSGDIIDSDTWYRKDLGISLEGIDEDFADKLNFFNYFIIFLRINTCNKIINSKFIFSI